MAQAATRTTKRFDRSAIVVAVLCILVQGFYWEYAGDDPTFRTPIVDAAVYHQAAVRFAEGQRLIDDAFWQPPLFPLFLGCLYTLVGPNVLLAKAVLAAVAVGSCLLIWWIGRRVFSRRVGLIAGVTLAFYGPFVFFSTQLLPTGLAVFLDLLAIAVWLWCLANRHAWYGWILLGLVAGLATLTVPNAAVLIVLASTGTFLLNHRPSRVRTAMARVALILLGFASVIAPVTVRNYSVSGEWVLISTNGGINFFVGNNPHRDDTIAIRPGEAWRRFARKSGAGVGRTRAEQSAYFFRRTLAYVTEHPADFLRGLGVKAMRLVNAREIPRNVDPYVYRDHSRLLSVLLWKVGPFGFPFGLLAPLAAVGAVVSFRRHSQSGSAGAGCAALLAFIITYGASIVCFFVSARYRLPVAVAMVLFAAVGGSELADNLAGRRSPSRMRYAMAATFVIGLFATLIPVSLATEGINFRAERALCLGDASASGGRLDEAESFLRRSLELNPRYADAAVKLAAVLAERGRVDEAELWLRHAVTWDDQSAEASALLGKLLHRQGRPAEASAAFKQAVTIDPTSPEGHAGLADVLVEQGRIEEAVKHYRQAVAVAEASGPLLVRLADALVRQQVYDKAIERYRQALWKFDPAPDVLNRIAWLLATCPRVDLRDCVRAVDLAEQACRMTSFGNASAMDTLAAAYAECGRWAQAVTWARRAVELATSPHAPAESRVEPAVIDAMRSRLKRYEDRLARSGLGKNF